MPSFLFVVKDTSPILLYSQNWRAGTSETDNLLDQYAQSTFTLTQTQGAKMDFGFYGSYVGVFGARRQNHGNYMVQMDGTVSPTFNGESGTAEFNQTLYSANVDLGFHNMTVINGGNTFFDIDYIAFETSIGKEDEGLIVNTFKDTHPSFTYTPSSAWSIPNRVGTFLGGTGHATTQPSARATFTFQVSDAIALYGSVGPNNTQAYTVQVDNGSPSVFNANKASFKPQEVLFYAGNLGGGQHTVQVQLPESAVTGELAIDYATVYSAPSLGGNFLSTAATIQSKMPPGTTAALAITTSLAVLSSLLCIYLFWRNRFEILRYSPSTPKRTMSILPASNSPIRTDPYILSPGRAESGVVRNPSTNGHSFGHSRSVSNAASQSLSAMTGPETIGADSGAESSAPPAPQATFSYGYSRNEKSTRLNPVRYVEQGYDSDNHPYSAGPVPPPSYF